MRLFIAINLPLETKQELNKRFWYTRDSLSFMNFAPEEGLHITLAFLGEYDQKIVPTVTEIIQEAADTTPTIPLTLSSTILMPSLHDPQMIWAYLDKNSQNSLNTLAQKIRTGLRTAFIDFDNKLFNAHVTISRTNKRWLESLKRANPQQRATMEKEVVETLPPDPLSIVCPASAITLFESRLTPNGHEYFVLFEVPLRK